AARAHLAGRRRGDDPDVLRGRPGGEAGGAAGAAGARRRRARGAAGARRAAQQRHPAGGRRDGALCGRPARPGVLAAGGAEVRLLRGAARERGRPARQGGRSAGPDARRLRRRTPRRRAFRTGGCTARPRPARPGDAMRIFDPHIHMSSRTTRDYQEMYEAGVRAVVEPAFWLGQPRSGLGSFVDYFDSLVGWEPFRAARFGVRHHCAVALNPKEANDPRCAGVVDLLPRYLAKDTVVAVGEVGYDFMTKEEDDAFARQLELAIEFDLPVLVHTPHRDKAAGTRRSLHVVRESGIAPERVIVDHLNELTVRMVLEAA